MRPRYTCNTCGGLRTPTPGGMTCIDCSDRRAAAFAARKAALKARAEEAALRQEAAKVKAKQPNKPAPVYEERFCTRCKNQYPDNQLKTVDGTVYCLTCVPAPPLPEAELQGSAKNRRLKISEVYPYGGQNETINKYIGDELWYIVIGSLGRRPVKAANEDEARARYEELAQSNALELEEV